MNTEQTTSAETTEDTSEAFSSLWDQSIHNVLTDLREDIGKAKENSGGMDNAGILDLLDRSGHMMNLILFEVRDLADVVDDLVEEQGQTLDQNCESVLDAITGRLLVQTGGADPVNMLKMMISEVVGDVLAEQAEPPVPSEQTPHETGAAVGEWLGPLPDTEQEETPPETPFSHAA